MRGSLVEGTSDLVSGTPVGETTPACARRIVTGILSVSSPLCRKLYRQQMFQYYRIQV